MTQYITVVNYGYGDEIEVIDADSQEKADAVAYEIWKEGAEGQAEYKSVELNAETAEEFGVEFEGGVE